MKKQVKNKTPKSKERLLCIGILILAFLYPLLHVFTSAQISESTVEIEKLENKIEKQKKVNESITMQINEMTSLDKVREIASENGLSYKNNHIAVVGES